MESDEPQKGLEECPQCGEDAVVRELHLGGEPHCKECGWRGTNKSEVNYQAAVLMTIRWGGLITLISVFVFFCAQFFTWGQYSFDATYLMAKQYSGMAEEKDYLELGAMCNAIKNRECALKYFKKVVDYNPRHKKALANLGINYALNGQWRQAKTNIEGYFSLGGNGYDVLLWYGRIMEALEGGGASIEWSYLALASKPTYKDAAYELIHRLKDQGKFMESLSVIGGMAEGHPSQGEEWLESFLNVQDQVRKDDWSMSKEQDSFQLAKVKGRHFYLPVSLKKGRPMKLFAIDRSVEQMWIDEDFVFANQISIPVDAPTHSLEWGGKRYVGREILLEEAYVGPWQYKSIKAVACGKCPFLFGAQPLSRLSYKLWSRHQTEFLTIRKK